MNQNIIKLRVNELRGVYVGVIHNIHTTSG